MRITTTPLILAASLATAVAISACGGTATPTPDNNVAEHETLRSDLAREVPTVSDTDLNALAISNHAFTLDIYDQIADGDDNIMISPVSMRLAFGLLYAGARGTTETEIETALGFDLGQEGQHAAFNALDRALVSRNMPADGELGAVELNIANAFWGRTGLNWVPSYLDTLAVNYGAGVESLDFSADPDAARVIINDWVEDRTNDRIVDLLPEGSLDAATIAVLTNAVFFKAPWQIPFETEATQDADFITLAGATVTAEMMSQSEVFGYGAGEGYEAIELTFRDDELGMVFILPDEGTFADFEAGLTVDSLGSIVDGLSSAYGRVRLPKFEFNSEFELTEALQALGMQTAFGGADLSGMIADDDLLIAGVFHKTFIAVDESGAEAAAATAIVVGVDSAPTPEFDFLADSPFLFAIRDRETGVILFYGRVADPTA